MNTKKDKGKLKLWIKLLRLRGRLFYMKYGKIIVLAIAEVIAELFYCYKKNKRE